MKKNLLILFFQGVLLSCIVLDVVARTTFYKGVDLPYINEPADSGVKYYDNGQQAASDPPNNMVKVVFKIDMSGANTLKAYITGDFTKQTADGNWNILEMTGLQGNIYTYTTYLAPGSTGLYYYLNDNDWDKWENVPSGCATHWKKDRDYEIPNTANADMELSSIWEQCADCSYKLSSNRSNVDATASTGSFSVTTTGNCSWTPGTTADWITGVNKATSANSQGAWEVTYSYTDNILHAPRTGTITTSELTYTVAQNGVVCTLTLPSTRTAQVPATAGTGTVLVTAAATDCTWTAVVNTEAAWLTITQGQTLTGSKNLSYTYEANSSSVARTGTITVGGQTYTITQSGVECSASLPSTRTANVPATAGTGAVWVTASATDCTWTATVNTEATWLTITQGQTLTGSKNLSYTYEANATSVVRTGTITVGGQTYTITQSGVECSASLPSTRTAQVSSTAGTGTVWVTAAAPDCTWTATVNTEAAWLTITQGQTLTGSKNLSYTYEANTTSTVRTGTITVGGQTYTITQSGVECSASLPSTRTAQVSSTAGTGTVWVTAAAADCTWTAAVNTEATWLTITQGQTLTGSKNLNYTYEANTTSVARTGTITVGGQTYTITQSGVECSVSLPSTRTAQVSSTAGTGTVWVTAAAADCTWTAAVNTEATWLTITQGQTLTGSKNLSYTYEENSSSVARTGTITVGGQTYTITQSGVECSVSLPSTRTAQVSATAGTGTVWVTAAAPDCTWTASVNTEAAWLTITQGQTLTGSKNLSYTYEANTTSVARTGTLTVGGQTYTITQSGVECSASLPSTRTAQVPATAGTGTVWVTAAAADCTWTATVNTEAAWLTITQGQTLTGSKNLSYTYEANSSSVARTGTITVGGQTYTISQSGVECSASLPSTRTAQVPATAGTGMVLVTASATDCTWTATVNTEAAWLTITQGQTLTGSKNLSYTYEENSSSVARTGTITVGGQTYTITQSGVECSVSLPSTRTAQVSATAGTGTVWVTAAAPDCTWTASVNTEAAWLTITQGQTLTGSKNLSYTYEANSSSVARTGTITVGGQTYTITQSGVECSASLPSTRTAQVLATAGTGTVWVTAAATDCTWTAAVNTEATWLTITQGQTLTGSKNLSYTYEANSSSVARTGTITVGGQTYTISQSGVECSASLPSTRTAQVPSTAGTGTVWVTAAAIDCTWTAAVNTEATWLTITQGQTLTGSKNLSYTYEANTTSVVRTGTITVGGQTYTITQSGVECSVSLPSTRTANVPATAGTGTVWVTAAAPDCTWTASVNTEAAWLTITQGQTLTGSKNLSYTYEANSSSVARTGTIIMGGQTYTIIQDGGCSYTLSSNSGTVPATAGTGSVEVVATGSGICSWKAVSNASWITIPAGQTLAGSKKLNYSYKENTASVSRTGTLTVAGYTFTVTQSAVVTGIETISSVKVFPNPAKDFVMIDLSGNEMECVSLKIVNRLGQILYKVDAPPAQALQIPLNGYVSGLYFIILQGKESASAQKLIVK